MNERILSAAIKVIAVWTLPFDVAPLHEDNEVAGSRTHPSPTASYSQVQ
jgi:hypothetical protein